MSQSESTTTSMYDSNGNFTSDGTKTYEWDAENRLTRVTQGATELARFTYDGKGRRVQKIVGGVTRSYIYDGASIIEERLSSGQTYDYVHGPGIDQPLAVRDQASVVSYYLADHLGSIVQTTNSIGAVTFTREYDPWGNPIQGSTTAGYAFTGREWDPETGLYYFRARYLDPKLGRFLSEDPIGVAAGLNLYAYVENNPVRLRDPLGLAPMSLPDLVTNYYCAFTYANDPAGMAACLTNAQNMLHPPPGSVPLIGCGVLTAVRIPTNITFVGQASGPSIRIPPGSTVGSARGNGTIYYTPEGEQIRIMGLTPPGAPYQYPNGYVRVQAPNGQYIDPTTGQPGPPAATHCPLCAKP